MDNTFQKALYALKEARFKFGADSTPTDTYKVDLSTEWQPFGAIDGDEGKLIDFGDEHLVAYKCGKGIFKPHVHTNSEVGIVLKGSMRIDTPDRSFIVRAGQSYDLKPNEWHSAEMLSDENFFVVMFYPYFKDKNVWEAKLESV